MALDPEKLVNTRLDICKSCVFYNKNNTCRYLIETTGKTGSLYHGYGITNPYTRCAHPERYWYSITSYHAWYLDKHLMKLTLEDRHQFTKYGIKRVNALSLVNKIYSYNQKKNLFVKRSDLLKEVENLHSSLNAYQHVSKFKLKVNYVSGTIT